MKFNKWMPIASVLTLGLVVVGIVMGFYIMNIASAGQRPTEDLRMKEIRAIEQELQNTNLSETNRRSLEAKLQALYYQITLQAEGINQLTKMPTQAATALQAMAKTTLSIEGKRYTGIIENPSVPFSASEFSINNAWQEYINGGYILVYAGSMTKDPIQGILIVCVDSNHGCRIFVTPQKRGALRITGYTNSRLIIQQSNAKENIFFDILALSFSETIDGPVTTNTPETAPQTVGTPYP